MLFKRNKLTIAILAITIALSACTKKWDNHDQVTDAAINNNLYQNISKTANTATFSQLLVKTGYDKVLASSKTYTVWVPTDQALQSLDPSILSDTAKLRLFVTNHICNQSYLASTTNPDQRIHMLDGKYELLSGLKFDSANIITANQYAANGIFHIIDKFVPRLDNCWEWMQNSTTVPMNKNYFLSLNYIYNDTPRAKIVGVDPVTGQTKYDFTGATINKNYFLDKVDVSDETNPYTLILLVDNSFTTELNKLTPWFKTSTTDSTNNLASFHLVKDLGIKGSYSPSQLPDTLVSTYGVKVPINKSAIVASYRTSNGWVHVMSQVNFTLTYKFPSVVVQGEAPTAFAADRTANVLYRIRVNPNNGQTFKDLLMQNYSYASYWINYNVPRMNSMRYNVYWVSVNDVQTTPLWQQRLSMDSATNATVLPYVTVAYQNYNEVLLGQITVNQFRNVNFYVVGPTVSTNSGGTDAISLDYIRFQPAF